VPGADLKPSQDLAMPPAGSPDSAAAAGGWDSHWKKRARVIVTDADLKGELADFQVPVKLTAPAFEAAAAKV
jgi:hypothetical protein